MMLDSYHVHACYDVIESITESVAIYECKFS